MKSLVAFSLVLQTAAVACDRPAHMSALPGGVTRVTVNDALTAEISSASDFVNNGDALFVLDWRTRQIVEFQEHDNSWKLVRAFGGQGNGPGEMMEPVALDYDSNKHALVVLERSGEIEYFDTTGVTLGSETVSLPCSTSRTQLVLAGTEKLVGQRCFGDRFDGLAPDTAYMVLAAVYPGRSPTVIAARAASSRSGDWGSIYVATYPIGLSKDTLFFGSGVDHCVSHIPLMRFTPNTTACVDLASFSAPEPAGFAKGPAMKAARWPDPLPPFVALTTVSQKPVLVRPASADSVVFESLDAPTRYFLVAPLNSFVGCKAAGCLWFAETEDGGRIHFTRNYELAKWMQ